MSGADHPPGLGERVDPLQGPPDSLQLAIFEEHRSVKVFDGEDFTEVTLKDAMRHVAPPLVRETETEFIDLFLRKIHERLRERSNAEVCQAYFEEHIRKPGVFHKDPDGEGRVEEIQPASAKSVPLKSMSNAELTKLGLPVQRKNRHGTK